VIIIKSEPIESVRIVKKELDVGARFIPPNTLEEGKSFSVAKKKVKIYSNGGGKYNIPEKWKEKGVTVYGQPWGPGGYIRYEFIPGKKEIQLGLPSLYTPDLVLGSTVSVNCEEIFE